MEASGSQKILVAGAWESSDRPHEIRSPYDGRIVGSVRARLRDDVCAVGRLIVHPDHQRQGIGSRLLAAIEGYFPSARCFELFTGSQSLDNLRLYERAGYRVTEVPVNHRPRIHGVSKYNFANRAWRATKDMFGVSWLLSRRMSYEVAETEAETR